MAERPDAAKFTLFFHAMSSIPNRILAVDPMTRGFGYVIFEEPFHLADCGFASSRRGDKRAAAVLQFEKLLEKFHPHEVVLEDVDAPGSRRSRRVRELVTTLAELGRAHGLKVSKVARTAVINRFSSGDTTATKQSIAEELTRHFPELRFRLPRPRKLWESEPERMSLFDALALAVTRVTA